ncbi:ComEA family DNA-binding protein [Allorhodopirellula solitaria]|uniref:Helix-hairpin-helix motif protein n=1 Tax=Allorhodopirellula solitaria TaxID=2527987 RepID=A0A5C5XPX8_9BACT|nr:helix-hairpin-helix domain-containing protein [Allorhodopirellula solitaria]TWT64639.1 Helix-hairpin-helix motif protein [Allorhodopirellula solitaria]
MNGISTTRGPLQTTSFNWMLVVVGLAFAIGPKIGAVTGLGPLSEPASGVQPDEPSRASPLIRLRLNDATAQELGLLPQIGPKMAERIIRYRRAQPSMESWADIESIPGMGPSTIQTIRPWCAIDPSTGDLASNH